MQAVRRLIPLFLPLAILACSGESITDPGPSAPIDLAAEWVSASPRSQGIDPGQLASAVDYASTLPRIMSLLVVRHGKLVAEHYFNGNTPDSLNDVRSVTKTVVGTLTAIAIRDGFINSVNDRIGDYLEAYIELEPGVADITIRDLLTMSSGFAWDESTSAGYNAWIFSGDYVNFLLDKPLITTPGASFNYNSAAVHLLSVVLQLATNQWIFDFADQTLFGPLGITRSRWEILLDGWPNGGSGIDLRPRDLAKLGALWLQDGVSGSSRILPAGWVDSGTSPAFQWWVAAPPFRDQNYGYLWWLTNGTPPAPAYLAWGHGGQFVYVVPGKDMVVVVTHDWRGANSESGQLAVNGLELIIEHVLPAAR